MDKAKCMYCGKVFNGKPYTLGGGPAFDVDTGERCKINVYGGYVCSEFCDINVCLEFESKIFGNTTVLSVSALRKIISNWH